MLIQAAFVASSLAAAAENDDEPLEIFHIYQKREQAQLDMAR